MIRRLIRPVFHYVMLLPWVWVSSSHAALSDKVEPSETTPDKVAIYLEDSQMTAKVKSLLLNKLGSDVTDVTVSTHQARVTLTGFVPSQRKRNQLTQLTEAVPGVKHVDNQVQLLSNQPATLKGFASDTLKTSDVKARLFSDPSIDSENIKVTTRHGEVFLSGAVPANQRKKLAEIIKKLSAAQRIHNNIKIRD